MMRRNQKLKKFLDDAISGMTSFKKVRYNNPMNLDIFTEAFLTRLIPIYHEVTLGAIEQFQFEQYPPNAALAGVGGLLALAIYYGIGVWLRRMPERVSTEEQLARIEKMRGGAHFWLPYLLILSPTPLGGIVVIAAGFFRVKPALVCAVMVASEILFRAMPYVR